MVGPETSSLGLDPVDADQFASADLAWYTL
jgi:hypothetical protein